MCNNAWQNVRRLHIAAYSNRDIAVASRLPREPSGPAGIPNCSTTVYCIRNLTLPMLPRATPATHVTYSKQPEMFG